MLHHIGRGFAGEEDRKFFPSHTEGVTSSGNARKAARDHAQYFIARFVAERVVDALEVIDVDAGHGVGWLQLLRRVMKRAA